MPERVLIIDDEENIRQMLRLTFIWNDGDVPRSGRLVLRGIDRSLLEQLAQQKGRK
jgi:hypothetical protein